MRIGLWAGCFLMLFVMTIRIRPFLRLICWVPKPKRSLSGGAPGRAAGGYTPEDQGEAHAELLDLVLGEGSQGSVAQCYRKSPEARCHSHGIDKKNWTILQSIILYCSLRRRGRSSPSPCSCLCSPTTSHVTKIRQTPWPWRQPSARRNKSFGACGGWSFCFWSLPRSFVAFIMCNTSHSVRRLASLRPSAWIWSRESTKPRLSQICCARPRHRWPVPTSGRTRRSSWCDTSGKPGQKKRLRVGDEGREIQSFLLRPKTMRVQMSLRSKASKTSTQNLSKCWTLFYPEPKANTLFMFEATNISFRCFGASLSQLEFNSQLLLNFEPSNMSKAEATSFSRMPVGLRRQ